MGVDGITDVAGVRVGHASRTGDGWLTGTTVVLAPEGGAVASVDVRGGGPGTRETDALDPRNIVQRVEAVVLTGGSAYGLAAASGVMAWLEERGRGFRVGPDPAQVVPVVPAAALFDLGRGGDFRARPDAAMGREAAAAAAASAVGAAVAQGNVGAGTGAVCGAMKGGVGSASVVLPSGTTVAALAVVNAAGSGVDPATGALYAELYGDAGGAAGRVAARGEARGGDGGRGVPPGGSSREDPRSPGEAASASGGVAAGSRPAGEVHAAALRRLAAAREETARRFAASARPPLNTTLAVVATDAALGKAQAQKLAGSAHDGLARAVRPAHLLSDGDTVFALATGARPLLPPDDVAADPAFAVHQEAGALNEVFAAGADVLTRAMAKALRAAESVDGPGGVFPSYGDLYGIA
ncbi:P1 family peptidase [Streptomyces sp. WMMC500]|uniref:P1 family peptidase n=1 Tax=Streptomyces sp. WMMC500 TaxID=3015154 RepID=UPI00248BA410|nr:P1 family peptidase [Streptomyces sp. WMMC500]WBB58783.1 P1 family peptidase [Streptomyces sp. WMMC500]